MLQWTLLGIIVAFQDEIVIITDGFDVLLADAVSVQCRTGACTDALLRGACFPIGPSGLLFSACIMFQILTGARLRATSPFHGARQAEIRHFDVTHRE